MKPKVAGIDNKEPGRNWLLEDLISCIPDEADGINGYEKRQQVSGQNGQNGVY